MTHGPDGSTMKSETMPEFWVIDTLRHGNIFVEELKDHETGYSVLATYHAGRWRPFNRWIAMVGDSTGRIGFELATFRFSAVRRAKRIARYFLAHQGECLDGGEL